MSDKPTNNKSNVTSPTDDITTDNDQNQKTNSAAKVKKTAPPKICWI